MRIPSGTTDQYVYFVAVDATDFASRETGLSSFTVYRSRNGGTAAVFTTPTINETDATNMPGVYELLLDEDTTIAAGNDSEEMVLHITHAGMAPVTRTIELYRPKITAGNTLGVASDGDISGNVDGNVVGSVASVTVGTLNSGVVTAASIAASALDGKGDWNIGKTGYTISGTKQTLDALNDISTTQVNTEVDSAIETYGLDHLVSASVAGGDVVDNSIIAKLVSSSATADWDTYVNTDDSLQAISESGGGGPTAAQISDAVWQETLADHSGGAGSTAEALSNASSAGDPWATALPGAYGAGTAGKIVGDNINAPLDTIDTVVDAIKVVTDAIPDNGAMSSIATAAALTTVDTVVDAILVDTGTTLPATLTTIEGKVDTVDTVVDAVLVDTGTTLPATLTTIEGKVDTVDTVVDTLTTTIGTAGAGLTDLGGMSTGMKAEVNAEVVDVIFTDTDAELTTVPAANAPIGDKINFVYMLSRNKVTQTATAQNLYRDDSTTAVGSGATVSDDTTTFTRGKFA